MGSPLIQPKETLKKKKAKIEKVASYDPGPIISRTCFVCMNRFPDILHCVTRHIDTWVISIRVCPSCQVGLTKFTPMRANSIIESTIEGSERYKEEALMKLTKKEMVELMREHGL